MELSNFANELYHEHFENIFLLLLDIMNFLPPP